MNIVLFYIELPSLYCTRCWHVYLWYVVLIYIIVIVVHGLGVLLSDDVRMYIIVVFTYSATVSCFECCGKWCGWAWVVTVSLCMLVKSVGCVPTMISCWWVSDNTWLVSRYARGPASRHQLSSKQLAPFLWAFRLFMSSGTVSEARTLFGVSKPKPKATIFERLCSLCSVHSLGVYVMLAGFLVALLASC